MSSGTESTLILHPDSSDLSDITFDMSATSGVASGYVVPAQSLDFLEDERLAIVYSEGAKMDGGRAISARGPLVALKFDVRVSDSTRAGMIQKATNLQLAITDENGGTLEFKPDGVGGDVHSTFFHYLQSRSPRLKQSRRNRWDGPPNSDGVYAVVLEIEIATLPFATSDPDSLDAKLSVTVENCDDASRDNYARYNQDVVAGSIPALMRTFVYPYGYMGLQWGNIGTLWAALRIGKDSDLDSFQACYYSAHSYLDPNPTGAWTTVVDANRCGGEYYLCDPDAINKEYGIRYRVAKTNQNGRVAIAFVLKDNSYNTGMIMVRAALTIADTTGYNVSGHSVYGDWKELPEVNSWRVVILGEFDIPEAELSGAETTYTYVDLYVKRVSGSGTLGVDFLQLLYTDRGVLEIRSPSGKYITTAYRFLVDNIDPEKEVVHAVEYNGGVSTGDLYYLCNPLGTPGLLKLWPTCDNRLDFLFERYKPPVFDDDFGDSRYGDFWAKLYRFDSDENWTYEGTATDTGTKTDHVVEGDSNIGGHITSAQELIAQLDLDTPLDLSNYGDADHIGLWGYGGGWTDRFELRFYSSTSDYYTTGVVSINSGRGYGKVAKAKGDYSATGNPDWGNITRIEARGTTTYGSGADIRFDSIRVVSDDPTDPGSPSETGGVWTRYPGEWYIQELGDDYSGRGLGCVHANFGSGAIYEYISLIDDSDLDYGNDVCLWVHLKINDEGDAGSNGKAGLVFRCSDTTPGSEDFYYLFLDPENDKLRLGEYVSGSEAAISEIDYTCDYGTEYYLGVFVVGSSIKCFVSAAESGLWDSSNLKIDTTDASHNSGKSGVGCFNGNTVFLDVELEDTEDRHQCDDHMRLTPYLLYRTIFPFSEE